MGLTSLLFHQSTLLVNAASSCMIDRYFLHCLVGKYLEKSYHNLQAFFFFNLLNTMNSGDYTHALLACISCKCWKVNPLKNILSLVSAKVRLLVLFTYKLEPRNSCQSLSKSRKCLLLQAQLKIQEKRRKKNKTTFY